MDRGQRWILVGVLIAAALASPIILRSHLSVTAKVVTLTLGTVFIVFRFIGMSWPGKQ